MSVIQRFLSHDEDGQGLAEYALILALIAIVAIIALIFLGGQVSQILSTVGARSRDPHRTVRHRRSFGPAVSVCRCTDRYPCLLDRLGAPHVLFVSLRSSGSSEERRNPTK